MRGLSAVELVEKVSFEALEALAVVLTFVPQAPRRLAQILDLT